MRIVRKIRDAINEETRDLSPDEFLDYIHREAAEAEQRIRKLTSNAASATAPQQGS